MPGCQTAPAWLSFASKDLRFRLRFGAFIKIIVVAHYSFYSKTKISNEKCFEFIANGCCGLTFLNQPVVKIA